MLYPLVMDDKVTTPITPDSDVEQKISPEVEAKDTPEIKSNPESKAADPLVNEPYLGNPFFYEVANHFGIEQRDYESVAPKLAAIVDYIIDEFDLKDTGDILLKISEIENKIQKPMWDEKRYTNLYRYIRLANQAKSVGKAMKALEKGEENG